ncbi:MAG: flavocytochrome c [Lentilactobacillus parabuchneri]|nr:flavocytochrome c [Lentilactobacillus parabuchneri]
MSERFEPTSLDKLEKQYDLVVIGSGSAGLTTAIKAAELGLHPVILEKMPTVGGDTKRASSGMNAAETFVQTEQGIQDSFGQFYYETLRGGHWQNDPDLLKYFTEHGARAIEWLYKEGVQLDDLTISGGMSVPRTHRPRSKEAIGTYLVNGLLKQVQAKQIPLFCNVKVTRILTEDKVTGVQIQTEVDQQIIQSRAVIIATGGFGASKKLISEYRPDLNKYRTTNQPGNTGDGILLAKDIGAKLVDMDRIQVHPTAQQDTDHVYLIGETVRGEGAILVDQNGNRFVNELETRDKVTAAIEKLGGTGAYLIFDAAVRSRAKAIDFYDHVGLVKSADNLISLAQELGVDGETLSRTVDKWNESVSNRLDIAFGRKTGRYLLETPPYAAIHVAPAIHYTMGGVKTNDQAEVLRDDGQPIPGLYAVGEVVGGLHGGNRIGGNSLSETVVFGLRAAQQVRDYIFEM